MYSKLVAESEFWGGKSLPFVCDLIGEFAQYVYGKYFGEHDFLTISPRLSSIGSSNFTGH